MLRKIKEINESPAELLLLRKRQLEAGRNRTRKSRANAKKKKCTPKPNLRAACRLSSVSYEISSKLDRLIPFNTENRIQKAKDMFETVSAFPPKAQGPFILQCLHEGHSIKWLEIKRGGVDPKGYGVFALQDIDKGMIITLYLGEVYNGTKEYHKCSKGDEYTLCSDVTYNTNWVERKGSKTYVSPALRNKRWSAVNDDMYLAAHLINSTDGTSKYCNVAFGESFQIYALKDIKKGTELLLNYNREIA